MHAYDGPRAARYTYSVPYLLYLPRAYGVHAHASVRGYMAVERTAVVALAGPSGVGKTTFAHALNGLFLPADDTNTHTNTATERLNCAIIHQVQL